MRVGIFTNTYYPAVNGVANCVGAYREGLMSRDIEVVVFSPAPADYDRREDPDNVYRFPTFPVPMDWDYSIAVPYSGSVIKALQRLDFDIIHTQHPVWVGAWGAWYARWADLPLITTVHTDYELFSHMVPLPSSLVEMYLRVRVTSYCNKCQVVTTPASSARQRLREQGVTTPIEILPNPVRIADFAQADGAAVRRRYGLNDDVVLLGSVGRLSPEKNLDLLVEAVGQVLHRVPNTAFLIAGNGPELEKVNAAVAKLDSSERVFFVSGVPYDQIPPYQAAIDILVSASRSETQPLAYTEAMAAQTPVVAVKAPGAADMIEPGVNGLLSDAEDGTEGLAQQILELVNDPQRRRAMGDSAQQWVQQFDVAHVTDRLLVIYELAIELGGEVPL